MSFNPTFIYNPMSFKRCPASAAFKDSCTKIRKLCIQRQHNYYANSFLDLHTFLLSETSKP